MKRQPVTVSEVFSPAHGFEVGGEFFKLFRHAPRRACVLAGWL